MGMAGEPIPFGKYAVFLFLLTAHSLVGGYWAAIQPSGAGWRFFSYHPMLMLVGFVGMMGGAALTKKRKGYTNTKLHGMMSAAGLLMAFGGLYVIYKNKNNMGKNHFTTLHARAGLCAICGCTLVALVGGVVLHPDFGLNKQDKSVRTVHKWLARGMVLLAWVTSISGVQKLVPDNDVKSLVMFALPMLIAAPFTLLG